MRYDQIHPYFPLVLFWPLLTYEMCEICCGFCPVGGVQCEQVLLQLSIQYPRGDRYKLRTSTKAWRANGLTMSKCQSTYYKTCFLSDYFWCVWGVGYNSKILQVKRCKHVNYLMFVCFFGREPPPPPPPKTFMIFTFVLGGQPSNLTVAYFFPMGLVQPPTANSIKAPNAATLRPAYVEAI